MKKINLLTDEISVKSSSLINALNRKQEFAITIDGDIKFTPFEQKVVHIYKGLPEQKSGLSLSALSVLQGKYKLRQQGDIIYIHAGAEWQNILDMNTRISLYEDVSADGIDVFKDEELENMGWHATDFDIGYREIVEEIEEKLEDGHLVFIEVNEPYRFSGFCVVNDIESTRSIVFNFVKNKIIEKIKNNENFAEDKLTSDEKKAAKYFGI